MNVTLAHLHTSNVYVPLLSSSEKKTHETFRRINCIDFRIFYLLNCEPMAHYIAIHRAQIKNKPHAAYVFCS